MDAFDLKKWQGFKNINHPQEPFLIDQVVIDSRQIHSPHSLFIAHKGEKTDGHHYLLDAKKAGAKAAIVSCELPKEAYPRDLVCIPSQNTIESLQEIALCYRMQLKTKILAITGSYGKTMLKDLLLKLLKTEIRASASPGSYNSQIGVPLGLFSLQQTSDIAIVEAAVSKQGEMDTLAKMIRPEWTILTPCGKKHLASLKNLSNLYSEVQTLIESTSNGGWAMLPSNTLHATRDKLLPFTTHDWDLESIELPHAKKDYLNPLSGYQIDFPDGCQLKGTIQTGAAYFLNLINMAVKSAWLLGISSTSIKTALQDYQVEAQRTEIWKSEQNITFINDTYCCDPQSIDRSLAHYKYAEPGHRKIFVFGGIRQYCTSLESSEKHAHYPVPEEFKRIGQAFANEQIDQLLLVGRQSPYWLKSTFLDEAKNISSLGHDENLFDHLKRTLKPKDVVILKGENKLPLDHLIKHFNGSVSNNQCIVNLAAIYENLLLIKQKLPPNTRFMMIVKALAYGTDDVRMAKFFTSSFVDILGVSYIDEAVSLRNAGINTPLFSIHAAPYEAAKVVNWDIEVGISDIQMLQLLANEAQKQNKIQKIHLHIDTGMGRFGCRPEDALKIAKCIAESSFLSFEGVMTHFACADDPSQDDFTLDQIRRFDETVALLNENGFYPKWIHAANSSAALRFHLPQYNMVRIGLAAYGLYLSEEVKNALDLRLALSLTSRIVAINTCKKGESISYGRRYTVQNEIEKIAVLPIGYFDGMHRNYSEKSHVLIHGQKAAMVGNICMDYMMVDVSNIQNVAIGDKVLIFGEDEHGFYQSPEELALSADSIVHELITCLGPRITRIFVHEETNQFR